MYRLVVSYNGYDQEFDRNIKEVVGRESNGSGYCFIDDTRDLDFIFVRLQGLISAKERVKSKLGKKVKIKIYDKKYKEIRQNSKIMKGK